MADQPTGNKIVLDDEVELPVEPVRAFSIAAYVAAGMAPGDAETVVENQLWSDLRGVDTHGVQRLPWYVRWFQNGQCDPTSQLSVVQETVTSIVADGNAGLGQLVITRFIEKLIPKGQQAGMVLGVIRNSNDWGCGANYPYKAAEAGLVCFATTTSVPNLAPFGSRRRLFGNNPIVFTIPRRNDPPIVLDMALTPVALGKVMRAKAEGAELPLEWGFRDRDGAPTADPQTALEGIIPAVGGYKGTGLAMITNVLAGILSGSSHTGAVDVGKRGQFFFLVDPGLLGDKDRFYDEIEDMVAQVRASGDDALPGQQVFLPGELEQKMMDARRASGRIPYPQSVVAGLRKAGERLGVPFEVTAE